MSQDPLVLVLMRRRKTLRISQIELATRTGISRRTIQRIESGESDLTLSQFNVISKVLELSVVDMSRKLFKHHAPTDVDIAALARLLPANMRQAVASLMIAMIEEYGD